MCKRKIVYSLFFLSFFLFVSGTAFPGTLTFGPPVVSLQGLEIQRSALTPGYEESRYKTLTFTLDIEKVTLQKLGKYDYLKLGNLSPLTSPGEPQIPGKVYKLILPLNVKITGVEVSNVVYRPLLQPVNLMPTPQPRVLSRKKGKVTPSLIPSRKIYASTRFFPGNLVKYYTGKDKRNTYVYVKFYPLQYIPREKKSIVVTSASIKVYYRTEEVSQPAESMSSLGGNSLGGTLNDSVKCLIIYPKKYQKAADALKNFHEEIMADAILKR